MADVCAGRDYRAGKTATWSVSPRVIEGLKGEMVAKQDPDGPMDIGGRTTTSSGGMIHT